VDEKIIGNRNSGKGKEQWQTINFRRDDNEHSNCFRTFTIEISETMSMPTTDTKVNGSQGVTQSFEVTRLQGANYSKTEAR
jgi:hypothetical protein